MNREAIRWVVELAPPMPAQLVATLTALAYHADKEGRGAYPSVPRLAALACKAERSVRRDLRELERLKLIRPGDPAVVAHLPADKRPAVYDLAMERTVPGGRAGDDDQTWTSARTLASARARGGRKRPSSDQESTPKREDVDDRGDVDVRADAHVPSDRTPTSAATGRGRPPNTTTEQPTTEHKDSSSPRGDDEDDLTAFGAFWLTYPKRKDKPAALEAWKTVIASGVDPTRIVSAAQAYARERSGEDPRFTKYPANWLKQGRYEDEPDSQSGRHLKAVGGHQPFQPPKDHSVYGNGF